MSSLLAAVGNPTGCPLVKAPIGSSIFASIAKPIADVLAGVYAVIPDYAVAIIGLSILWMVIIAPLTLKSTRSMLAMQKLQPEMKKLQAEHKNDRQALNQAMMDLYREHGVSPFGSCLPMLLPLPVFFALFRVIDGLSHVKTVTVGGQALRCVEPNYLSPQTAMFKAIVKAHGHLDSLSLDLSKNALSNHGSFAGALPYFVLLLLMIGTQYLQTARMMSRNPATSDNPQQKMMKYLPIIFGVIFIRFPAGVILYYTISNVCRVLQQEAMYAFDPKVKDLANREIKAVETEIGEIETGKRRRERPAATSAAPPARGSRFRDLLATAKEQQQQQRATSSPPVARGPQTNRGGKQAPRPVGSGGKQAPRPVGSGGKGGNPKPGAGQAKRGSPPTENGATPSGGPGRPAGARTGASRPTGSNRSRKRRGR